VLLFFEVDMSLLLALAALCTSFLSGVLGMAGGMLLMGIYAWLLPVAAAMVLHGVTQLASNGVRSFLLWPHICWSVLRPYLCGCFVVALLFAFTKASLPSAWLFLLLGALPFIASLGQKVIQLEIQRPAVAFVCGAVVTGFQLLAGVSGPALDVFFQHSSLTPKEIVATKAMTQTLGHTLKLIYYGAIFSAFSQAESVLWWHYAIVIVAAYVGTNIGKEVLSRLDATQFRTLTTWTLYVIGVVYLYQGITAI
jgi:uncharacterized membrane protein YfcA